jgi:hypothetical protein
MYTKDFQQMLSRELVYGMLTKEDNYAKGWGEGKKTVHPEFPDHVVSRSTGEPFGVFDFLVFAEKYLDEAKLAHANYTPDRGAIRIRLIKAASLLVTALQVHGAEDDWDRLAGVSSTKFPIMHGGLELLKQLQAQNSSVVDEERD